MSLICDLDDFGSNHVISDQCQSHDCRDKLEELKKINPEFKVTLFTIPAEMTAELFSWTVDNSAWVELAVHGFFHSSNYECEALSYEEFDEGMQQIISQGFGPYFAKGFKAPGWQISDDIYLWLRDNGWWVADQGYNDHRRPPELPAYVNYDGVFKANGKEVEAWHGHTWDCVGNGIYETFEALSKKVAETKSFKFISEVLHEN